MQPTELGISQNVSMQNSVETGDSNNSLNELAS